MARHGLDRTDEDAGEIVEGARQAPPWRGEQIPAWLLRTGLAFAFLYAATSSLLHPTTFARYFPSLVPYNWAMEMLPAFALYEVVLAVLLFTPRFTFVAAVLAATTLVAIVVANPDAFDVLFRNVAIACAALALALEERLARTDSHRSVPATGAAGPPP